MKILGEGIFAKDANGRLVSRIGTIFFRTSGLVTKRGVHAMQRVMWIEEVNRLRAEAGKPPLSPSEEDAEIAESVDLIFTEDTVLIRPNPDRMDLAFRADEELQQLVSKRLIRYLNTNSLKVRKALRERGENWRMARKPISQDDMVRLIESSRASIGMKPVYYYNPATGTRFLTVSAYGEVAELPPAEYRAQVKEVVSGLNKRNRTGHPEVDVFPPSTPPEIRKALKSLDVDSLDDAALRSAFDAISLEWRMTLPPELREETAANFEWRNAMCNALTAGPNETSAGEQELIAGISPEFYRQIEWLPGARIDGGEVVFDPIYDEAARTGSPELLEMCDNRVKSFLFNTTRLFGRVKYINIGRIANSLARRPVKGDRRGHVYIMQYEEEGSAEPKIFMIRLQKWGVAEHLDEGKDLLQSIIEADEYSDYILDRRLMCCQLGMNLPRRLGYGHFTETYRGDNRYNGMALRTAYFVRRYVPGIASDKVPPSKCRNPAWAVEFARLMGRAAAIDMVVGRRSSVTGEMLFDTNYEVVQVGEDGLPEEVKITDHAGSFVDYATPLEECAPKYADFALSRRDMVVNWAAFSHAYVEGFAASLAETRDAYRARRKAFDGLFGDRPYDTNGSGAYRWAQVLKRLDECDVDTVVAALRRAVGC